jgi:hypothetical protein
MDLRRKRIIIKALSAYVGLNMLFQLFFPTVALALTGGPSQPEMQGFTPIGVTNMVDLSSGSFTYNIPLMDVDGYPINLSYKSGITMDQEASWVGLGWNINPGEINRQMRGLPDDFSGDQVTQNFNMKDNTTVGFDAGIGFKIANLPLSINASLGVFYNNYKGPGVNLGITPSISAGSANSGTLTGSLGINFNSQSGLDISPNIGFSKEAALSQGASVNAGITVGTSYNSRTGLKGLTMSKDVGFSDKYQTTDDKGNSSDQVASGGMSTSSTMSFSAPSYTPTMTMPLQNTSLTLQATAGLGFFTLHPNLSLDGYYNNQTLATKTLSLPAYGYMYADQAKNNPKALHDFNREKDVPYMEHIANLPITNFTYDLYSINGQGVSGQFRPFRGDVGVLYDHEMGNTSVSGSLGLELGFTEVSHNGININFTTSNTVTGQWQVDNDFATYVGFRSAQANNINYEPFYIKKIGEKTVNDTNYYNSVASTSPMYVRLDRYGSDVFAKNILNYNYGAKMVSTNPTKTRREKRNQCTSLLTAQEATYFGLDRCIKSYPFNKNVFDSGCYSSKQFDTIPRSTWPAHHISEVTVTNPDGKRYVYGTPAYNTYQEETTFAVNGNSSPSYSTDSVNLVKYTEGTDNGTNNPEGRDNYFNQQILPPYAHSYLLTGVLSPDYVDLTGNGITDDDLGEAVKINYTQIYSQTKPYRWRTPYEKDTASYQMGLLSDVLDDKGNYIYGNKEIWYVHSIESKTMVAQFILESREDGLGVKDNNGGRDATQKLQRLKEINLYSKADLIKNGYKAVPIKTVHFVYDYSLCPGTPNSIADTNGVHNGKLTLKKVYFTYGNNTEGSLNSYQFTYSSFNPKFSHNRYDRWGYYKNNNISNMPSNMDYPYADQDSASANLYCAAWDLTGIRLPSGGQITVDYEPNDYGYVQNQRATQMFTVLGANKSASLTGMNGQLWRNDTLRDWLIVRLPTSVASTPDFYNKYLSGINQLYFRFLVNLDNKGHYEYVPGYATIGGYQKVNDTLGAIYLNTFATEENELPIANPVAAAAWQFVRLNLPQYAYPGSSTSGGALGIIEALGGIMFDVLDIFQGFDKRVYSENYGQNFIYKNSWVRLDNPNYKKYGGGARVKEIDISDNWANMASGQPTFKYGQTFNYTNTIGNGQVISSGVATYEPATGGDENPLRQPMPYDQKYLLAPNNNYYTETPLGESLYPSPEIVYSKVTVANLAYPGITRTATGYTVNEFYTAYDFPVINKYTDIDPERIKPNILASIFSFGVQDFTNVSQGFSVEVNDMAGKEKDQEVYDQNGSLISSAHYYYNVDNANAPSMHLNNNVKVINSNGMITTASLGKDIDVWEDMREQDSQTQAFGVSVGNEFFVFPFIAVPVDIPPIFPSYSASHTRFRSAVSTKYIYRSGIVDSVVNMQNGSTVTTKNLLFDGETGDVVLTQTNNEFDAPTYKFTYPAHWAYDGMGPEYQNIGALVTITSSSSGVISIYPSGSPSTYFEPGDEIETYASLGVVAGTKYWVTQPTSGGNYIVMDYGGNPIQFSTSTLVKIIRSGRRNMSSTPVGSFTSMVNPIHGDSIIVNQNNNIVQASGTIFNDAWSIPFSSVQVPVCNTIQISADTCLAQFLDSLVFNNQLFATPSQNLKFGKYVKNTACHNDTSEQYYALVDPVGMDAMSNFKAQLGENILTISSVTGYPVSLYSLLPYYGNMCSGPPYNFHDSISGGCLNLFSYDIAKYTYPISYSAMINSSSALDTVPDPNDTDIMALSLPLHVEADGLMWFDMPFNTGTVILNASLYLYADSNNQEAGVLGHPDTAYNHTSDDKAWLRRITTSWSASTVTYNSIHTHITTSNQVAVPNSTWGRENYVLNITNLANDMFTYGNYGLELIENNGNSVDFSSLIFGSNVNPKPSLQPKVVIQYTHWNRRDDPCYYPLAATACLTRTTCHDSCENLAAGRAFNPYAMGMLGNWRPQRNYVYYDTLRAPLLTSTNTDIWKNGIFQDFTNLWASPVHFSSNLWSLDTADKNWTWTNQITNYDLKGNEVEDEDALGRYSGALYGYLNSLPVAVSANAKYREIAFDGFEDYGFNTTCNSICNTDHFSFRSDLSGGVDTTSSVSHTGKYSLMISASDSATVYRGISYYGSKLDSISSGNQFLLLNGGQIPLFSPDSGSYLLSAWVKENATCGATGYKKDSIVIRYTGSSAKYTFHAAGPVIEGWQRFEGKFKVPKNATSITVKLVAGTNTAYYDDIRIEPFAAEMKTYVYDPSSMRLLATLDENNYATIYEYNDEGILMRVKKETEKGVMTIKESRSTYPR